MIEFLTYIIVIAALLLVFLLGYLFRYFLEAEQSGLPYRMYRGLEDMNTPNVRRRVFLRDVRDLVEDLEEEETVEAQIIASIRTGRYDPEQPAAPRRGNGHK